MDMKNGFLGNKFHIKLFFSFYQSSVSNHELIYLYTPSSGEVLEEIEQPDKIFFEYQLQTGVVLAFDHHNQLIWTSVIDSPIAAVWELKNGQLKEKSLFKTRLSHGLAFMGEFNSTPYVIISSRIQRQLILNARKSKSLLYSFIFFGKKPFLL